MVCEMLSAFKLIYLKEKSASAQQMNEQKQGRHRKIELNVN